MRLVPLPSDISATARALVTERTTELEREACATGPFDQLPPDGRRLQVESPSPRLKVNDQQILKGGKWGVK